MTPAPPHMLATLQHLWHPLHTLPRATEETAAGSCERGSPEVGGRHSGGWEGRRARRGPGGGQRREGDIVIVMGAGPGAPP